MPLFWGLQVLRMPLFQLPQLITQLVNARVAITRLQEFLSAPQQSPSRALPAAEPGPPPRPSLEPSLCRGTSLHSTEAQVVPCHRPFLWPCCRFGHSALHGMACHRHHLFVKVLPRVGRTLHLKAHTTQKLA